jgi:sugar lactone lactonase YvrE
LSNSAWPIKKHFSDRAQDGFGQPDYNHHFLNFLCNFELAFEQGRVRLIKEQHVFTRRIESKMRPRVFIFSGLQPVRLLPLCVAILLSVAQIGWTQTGPVIVQQPAGQSVRSGSNVNFSVSVAGTGPFFYQWQFNGANLPPHITTVAGTGMSGYSGDGGAATNASLDYPADVVVDAVGNLFVADYYNNRVRKVDTSGLITSVAGTANQGFSGDGGAAVNASLKWPSGVAVDAAGNLFLADSGNNRVRKVDTNGLITTLAGNGGSGCSGDGGAATNAELDQPWGVAVDGSGNVFFSDCYNQRICVVQTNGLIQTIAGNGLADYSGDGDAATNASLYYPSGVALDASGNLFIADYLNNRVRKVDTSGIITTAAGGGTGLLGDGGPALNASLYYPSGVAVDPNGNLFIADTDNNRIRKVDANGIITTVAGNGTEAYSGDGGAATNAGLYEPWDVAADAFGNLFIADTENSRVRKVFAFQTPTLALTNLTAAEAGSYSVVVSNSYGSVTSSVALLSVLLPPSFTAQPQNLTGTDGSDATFSVTVAGTPLLYYQWSFDGASLPGQTNSTLTLNPASPTNAGSYSVVVTNLYGSVTSSVATLMLFPLILTTQPQNQTVTIGNAATFGVAVAGTPPFFYQWSFDGAALSGQTNSTLTLYSTVGADIGSYQVVVTNLYGSVTSSAASLNLLARDPFAPVWQPTSAPQFTWTCIASSADGTTLAAGNLDGAIYITTNSGQIWAPTDVPSLDWTCITVSPDGTVLAALNQGGLCYISTNAGAIWQLSLHALGNGRGSSLASSADGTHLVVVGRGIYTSTNSGATWSYNTNISIAIGLSPSFSYIAPSGDGTQLLVSEGQEAPGELLVSTNSGASWFVSFSNYPPVNEFFCDVTSSADGSKLTASTFFGSIYISTNSGGTWSVSKLKNTEPGVASSVDGSRLVEAGCNGIYTSSDFGATWTSNNVLQTCWQVACSQDGTRLVAIGNDLIYTAQWPPDLSLQPSGGSMLFSWPAPSTGFVLQQSADLTMTNWITVPITPVTSNYQNQVTLPSSSNAMFFRLAGPSF